MTRLFVSYSREDEEVFVEPLINLLRDYYGHDNVWYDRALVGGALWWDEVLEQIAAADVFLYVLSEDAVASPYCLAEFEEARRLGCPVVTVLARPLTHLPGDIAKIQYVDLSQPGDILNALKANRLYRAIDTQAKRPRPPRPHWSPATPLPAEPPAVQATASPGQEHADTPSPQAAQGRRGCLSFGRVLGLGLLLLTVAGGYLVWSNWPSPEEAASNNPTATNDPIQDAQHTPGDVAAQNASTATPTPDPFQPVTRNDEWQPLVATIDEAEMVLVPAGCFRMGSADWADDEKPPHEICFNRPFWIDRYEVTRGQYAACAAADGCAEPRLSNYSERDTQPINRVTWSEAQTYCRWRGARLPTEAEWEYAARGPSNLVFPWGTNFEAANAVYQDNSNNVSADVGSRPGGVSWVGAHDMAGNMWEWTSTLYAPYPYRATDGREIPITLDEEEERVLRGGSFFVSWSNTRTTNRGSNAPGFIDFVNGLRCAKDY